jgi:hypothetical protein
MRVAAGMRQIFDGARAEDAVSVMEDVDDVHRGVVN